MPPASAPASDHAPAPKADAAWTAYADTTLISIATASYGQVEIGVRNPSDITLKAVKHVEVYVGSGRFLFGFPSLSPAPFMKGPHGATLHGALFALALEAELLDPILEMERKIGTKIHVAQVSRRALEEQAALVLPLVAIFPEGERLEVNVTPCNTAGTEVLALLLEIFDMRSNEVA